MSMRLRTLLGFAVAMVAAPGLLVVTLFIAELLFWGGGPLNGLIEAVIELTRYGTPLLALPTIGLALPAWQFLERRVDTRPWHALVIGGVHGAVAPLMMGIGFPLTVFLLWTGLAGILSGGVFWLVARPDAGYGVVRTSSRSPHAARRARSRPESSPTLPR